ncbi:hypothetical protein B0H14DRAFT_2829247 [Mycena olivaceomarginata]|nr:hypothetical protein B0H14DRAFT_2829247 [Mycena olivaceomarginata]
MSPVFDRKRYHVTKVGKAVCACTDGIKVSVKHPTNDVCETRTPIRSSPDAWHANCWATSRQKAQGTSRTQAALPSACTHTPSMPARMPQSEGRQRPPAHLRVCTRAAPHSPLRWDERTARSSLETGRDGDEGRREEDGGGAGLRGARGAQPGAEKRISGDEVEGGGWMTLNSREIRLRVGETQRETFRAGVGCAHRQARRRTEDLKLSINCQLQPSPIQEEQQ